MGLMRRLVLGDLDLTDYPFSIEWDESHGAPENVYDVLVSMLADGDMTSSPRSGNREITLPVLVEGATLHDLALNEAALVAECDKVRNTLSIDPGDGYAAASVFDTFRVQARLVYSADLEQANFRRYELTIPAWPYPRGADLVETAATEVVVTPTYTLIDNGSSLTGWTTSSPDTISLVSGTIRMTSAIADSRTTMLRRTASLDLTGERFLAADVLSSIAWTNFYVVPFPSSSLTLAAVARVDLGGGITRVFFSIPAGVGVTTALQFQFSGTWAIGSTFSIDQVQFADSIPVLGTARQKALALVPGGSVRTQGSIAVEHATNSLGQAIVYTHPSGTAYLPPLTPWRSGGSSRTSDATLLSGARNAVATATTYDVPISALPRGRVEVWAWLRSNAATEFGMYWSVDTYLGGVLLSDSTYVQRMTLAANVWTLVCLGAATMPPVDVGPAGYVQVALQRDAADAETVEVDEAYLFATDEGRLTVVDCGTSTAAVGGPSNRLWIDAPSLDAPTGGVYRGNAADRSDQWHAQAEADVWQVHNFAPGGTSVFVATQGTVDAETSLTHHRRWHTHNGDGAA